MKVLVVHANPDPESFGSALRDAVVRGLKSADHNVTVIDLEAEDYQPVLTRADYDRYDRDGDPSGQGHPDPTVARHIDAVRAAEVLIFTFPTFWSGLPAVLKGWIDRTMLPGVSFSVRANGTIRGELGNVRRVVGVTTYGSPPRLSLARRRRRSADHSDDPLELWPPLSNEVAFARLTRWPARQ